MRRRRFFQTLGSSAALLPIVPGVANNRVAASDGAVENFSKIPAVNPGDLEAYFTEEKLRQAIDTTV